MQSPHDEFTHRLIWLVRRLLSPLGPDGVLHLHRPGTRRHGGRLARRMLPPAWASAAPWAAAPGEMIELDHVQDLVRAMLFLVGGECDGIFNGTARNRSAIAGSADPGRHAPSPAPLLRYRPPSCDS